MPTTFSRQIGSAAIRAATQAMRWPTPRRASCSRRRGSRSSLKIYGEYVENQTKGSDLTSQKDGGWTLLYKDALAFEAGKEKTLKYENDIHVTSSVPRGVEVPDQKLPQFDLNIPDQYRVDLCSKTSTTTSRLTRCPP